MTAPTRVFVVPIPGSPDAAAAAVVVALVATTTVALLQLTYTWHGDRSQFLLLSGVSAALCLTAAIFFRLRGRTLHGGGDRWVGLVFLVVGLHFFGRLALQLTHPSFLLLSILTRVSWVVTEFAAGLILLYFAAAQLAHRKSLALAASFFGVAVTIATFLAVQVSLRMGIAAPSAYGVGLSTLFLVGAAYSLLNALRLRLQRDVWLAVSFLVIAAAHADLAWSRFPYDSPFMWGHVLFTFGVAIPLIAAVIENVELVSRQARLAGRLKDFGKRVEVLLDSLPVAVLTLDKTGQLRYANRSCSRLLGVPPGLSQGVGWQHWSARLVSEDKPELERAVTSLAREAGESWSGILRTTDPDGSVHWLSVRAELGHDPVEDESRVQVVAADISELHVARRTAEDRQDRLTLLTNLAQTVAGETAEEQILQRFLSLTSELLPLTAVCLLRASPDGSALRPEVILGNGAGALFRQSLPAGDHPAWDSFRDGYPRFADAEDVFPAASPARLEAEQVLYLPLLAGGHVVGVVAGATDRPIELSPEDVDILMQISALLGGAVHLAELVRELDEQRGVALEASRLKSEFLANTSHELRTPLTSILGFLRLILDGRAGDPERQLQYLGIAHTSAQRLLELINDVLDLAKIEAGRLEIHSDRVKVSQLMTELEALFRQQMQGHGIELKVQPPDEDLEAWADPDRVRQITTNLLSNALKFTPPEGTVQLAARMDRDNVLVTVQDSGVGIPRPELEKVFTSFYQVDGSTTRGHGGTGLGLTISRRLAEMMGGRLWLASEGPGHGSTATLVLPAAEKEESEPQPSA
ncbi:MAG: GAF domain-containing protein [Acidobacteria bacterium]|nr:GAF domain-containing protein [Acidobacteriota bacterium]